MHDGNDPRSSGYGNTDRKNKVITIPYRVSVTLFLYFMVRGAKSKHCSPLAFSRFRNG